MNSEMANYHSAFLELTHLIFFVTNWKSVQIISKNYDFTLLCFIDKRSPSSCLSSETCVHSTPESFGSAVN